MNARPAWSDPIGQGLQGHGFARTIQTLLRVTQGLPLQGWERSVRLSTQGVSHQRLLVGFNTLGVSSARMQQLPVEWDMPEPLTHMWRQALPHARQILLAVEALDDGVVDRRAYLQLDQDDVTLRGFKWREGQVDDWRQTDYQRVPLDLMRIHAALSHAIEATEQPLDLRQAQETAREVLDQACAQWRLRGNAIDQAPFEVLAATETTAQGPSARGSLCLRLYDLELAAESIFPPLQRLLRHWNLHAHGAAVRSMLSQRSLGWLAVGQDRQGQAFLTIYVQASVQDAWQCTAPGTGL